MSGDTLGAVIMFGVVVVMVLWALLVLWAQIRLHRVGWLVGRARARARRMGVQPVEIRVDQVEASTELIWRDEDGTLRRDAQRWRNRMA